MTRCTSPFLLRCNCRSVGSEAGFSANPGNTDMHCPMQTRTSDMAGYSFIKDDQYVLNYSAKYLARSNTDRLHAYGPTGVDAPRDRILEAWRFPSIGTYGGGAPAVNEPEAFSDYNEVTFIYAGADAESPASVSVIGTFATLCDPIPMQRINFEDEPTRYWSVTYVVPK